MKYFAYGMNTNVDEMARRCPGSVSLGSAWLDDYELCFRTHCDIEHKPGARTYGVLWDINLDHLRALDALEGYPTYYTRFNVKVKQGRVWYNTLVYQMNNQHWLADPGKNYLDCVTEGYRAHGVPLNQIDTALNNVSCFMSGKMSAASSRTWSPMIRDYV